jgi:hypothetical protein
MDLVCLSPHNAPQFDTPKIIKIATIPHERDKHLDVFGRGHQSLTTVFRVATLWVHGGPGDI